MTRVLIAAPHPDDDLIGCGGSLIRHIRQGNLVAVVYMTTGDAGGLGYTKEELAAVREKETRAVAASIGISDLIFLDHPDGYLEYNRQSLIELTNLLRRIRPELLYIPHLRDAHPDHAATHRLWVEACRRAGGPWFAECPGDPWRVETILCYEVWTPLTEVNYTEDISEYMEMKLAAIEMHQSQVTAVPYHEAVAGLNRYRGITTGKGRYCECFYVHTLRQIEK